ncbi:hypothetical protein KUTeg_002931 [Tegillarca granosa]|uniref:Uncharacterized protein n=1 Tax=Tegillarca granosa TaxID=220873 RepID=A0ABQ9FKL8_TEGGR|nr:hypothetical protein KUTeg_002931 [Tegillarca granosa]
MNSSSTGIFNMNSSSTERHLESIKIITHQFKKKYKRKKEKKIQSIICLINHTSYVRYLFLLCMHFKMKSVSIHLIEKIPKLQKINIDKM